MPAVTLARTSSRRRLADTLTRRLVALGGAAVMAAIALIFVFLVWVVVPIFAPAGVERLESRDLAIPDAVSLTANDTFEAAAIITRSGELIFLDLTDLAGPAPQARRIALTGEPIQAAIGVYPSEDTFALLTAGKRIYFYRIAHEPRFVDNLRSVISRYEALFDAAPVALGGYIDNDIAAFDVFRDGERLRLAVVDNSGTTVLLEFSAVDNAQPLRAPTITRLEPAGAVNNILFGPGGRWLYRFTASGAYRLTDITSPQRPVENGRGRLVGEDSRLLALEMLLGRYSVLVADETGAVTQWSLRRGEPSTELVPVRDFQFSSPIVGIATDPRRKGFVAFARDHWAHLVHTTSHDVLASFELDPAPLPPLAGFSAGSDRLLLLGANRLGVFALHNDHPEISWSTLWRKIFYEGYDDPVYSWQSSSADTDFEPKFSLVPLLFGTLKAAFYAMLFAMPLAIMGAVYTACFMSTTMRQWMRPGIEMLAALPTVVLGFLAGLWLAPLVESMLAAVLLSVIVLPAGVLAFAFAWQMLPHRLTVRFDGWFALITVPLLLLIGYAVFSFDAELSTLLFGGDATSWVHNTLGLDYEQRNALIVGMAMGLAVIPVIFSVCEEAVHGVPAHLVAGSLALGATRWQTVTRIVIVTAAPGIFSAIMMGLGRAVGETMIVLMAAGNTPILDMNIFQGMRTFTANIAVELPEAEVASSHYRILFLIALVLFVLTFAFNTVAELVRERLRVRYAKL